MNTFEGSSTICNECELGNQDLDKVGGFGSKKANIAIVLSYPINKVSIKKSPYVGEEGKLFKYLLNKVDLVDKKKVRIIYSCRCITDIEPNSKVFSSCKSFVKSSLNDLPNLKVVILVGKNSLKSVLNKTGINKLNGQIISNENYVVIPTLDLYQIIEDKENKRSVINNLLEAKSIIKRGLKILPETKIIKVTKNNVELFETKLFKSKATAVDIETSFNEDKEDNYLYSDKFKILSISFTFKRFESWVIIDVNNKIIKKIIKTWLKSKCLKIGHHLKFDLVGLEQFYKVQSSMPYFDTLLAHYLFVTTARGTQSLKYLAIQETDFKNYEEEFNRLKKTLKIKEWEQIPKEALIKYNGLDTIVTYELYLKYKEYIKNNPVLFNMYMEMVELFKNIEQEGVLIDLDWFKKLKKKFDKKIKDIDESIINLKYVTSGMNLNSPQQVSEVIERWAEKKLNINKLDSLKRVSTGFLSTNEKALKDYSKLKCKFATYLLDRRKLSKLKSTYVDAAINNWIREDGKVHTNYNLSGTITGRCSSSNPNLLNIPARGENGKLIKQGFIAPEGYTYLSADFSQIELRVMAVASKSKAMLKAFKDGEDIHEKTASEIEGVKLEDVTEYQRFKAKEVNFGLIYGRTKYGLAAGTNLSIDEADEYIKEYFKVYTGIEDFIYSCRMKAIKFGYVETLFGLKIPLPKARKYSSVDTFIEKDRHIANEAINSPIQGTAGQIGFSSMIQLTKAFKERKYNSKIINSVYDSVEMYSEKNKQMEIAKFTKKIMENITLPFKFNCPIIVDVSIGDNWGNLTDIKNLKK